MFRANNGLLFCNYCDLSVEWKYKLTIDTHCASKNILHKRLFSKKKKKLKINKLYMWAKFHNFEIILVFDFRLAELKSKLQPKFETPVGIRNYSRNYLLQCRNS